MTLSIRYIPLPVFLAYFESKQLLLKRIDLYEDKHEGSPNYASWEGGMSHFKFGRMVWTNCWANYENDESIAMWDLYAKQDGVALVVESEKLKLIAQNLQVPPGYELCASGFDYVSYSINREEGDFLAKRPCFRHEEEQRVWARMQQVGYECEASRPDLIDYFTVPLRLSELQEIIFAPRSPIWLCQALQNLISQSYPELRIRRSDLLSD